MIAVKDLEFSYPKTDSPTIKGLNFEVEDGEVFGFLGPSGAGKSTTQKILIGLIREYKGHIKIMDKDLPSWKEDYYEEIGVSFEFPNHYLKLTAFENLNLFRDLYSGQREEIMPLLEMVGLEEDAHKKVQEFSKGMKMRLNFVKALLNKPRLIFLDEPTSGMDPVNARKIKNKIKDLKKQGKTIFLTTHNMFDADELCDRVAFIVDGEISLIDTPRQMKIKKGKHIVKVEYFKDQTRESCEFALDTLGENKEFLQLIKNHKLETIHSQEATLEDVFISVTGRELA